MAQQRRPVAASPLNVRQWVKYRNTETNDFLRDFRISCFLFSVSSRAVHTRIVFYFLPVASTDVMYLPCEWTANANEK